MGVEFPFPGSLTSTFLEKRIKITLATVPHMRGDVCQQQNPQSRSAPPLSFAPPPLTSCVGKVDVRLPGKVHSASPRRERCAQSEPGTREEFTVRGAEPRAKGLDL